jgi:hypothetical protein
MISDLLISRNLLIDKNIDQVRKQILHRRHAMEGSFVTRIATCHETRGAI